jgi:alpha-L-fucosidase
MDLYQKAGAKYFVSMGVHHDNFDLWNSKYHSTWNSVATGPRKDIVGLFRKAALKRGMRFGVSEHLGPSYHWFGPAYGSDKLGPYAGVPYDGRDPRYAELYHPFHEIPERRPNGPKVLDDAATMPDAWKREYVLRLQDLIDNYQPDLLYTDGPIRYEEWGLATIAHLYNRSAQRSRGAVEAVYSSKGVHDCAVGTCVLDLERGLKDKIWDTPWQTDTCIGQFHYNRELYTNNKYRTPKMIIDQFVDIVSRNGNLLLNFPLRSDGTLDEKELAILEAFTGWMAINSEAIHGSRPWKTFGEGQGAEKPSAAGYKEGSRKELTASDVRFTTKGSKIYAFLMGRPGDQASIAALAANGKYAAGKILNVELLGYKGKLNWTQGESALSVDLPREKMLEKSNEYAVTLEIQV